MKSFSLAWPAGVTDPLLAVLYDVTQMGPVETYSDLEYTQYTLLVGGAYHFSPALYLKLEAELATVEDDETYVYGDQSGDFSRGSMSVGYNF
jgi:hypothetical protein